MSVHPIIGDIVNYKSIAGPIRQALIERYVESTIIAKDIKTTNEVVFDCSDFKQWMPK